MTRQMMACFYLCLGSLVVAGDATIDKVVTFENDDKTSVMVHYSGADRLRFFALDSADGVFSLDLPGVFSRYDFSTLSFPQVSGVKQVPLDPEVSNGISVRFFMNPGVTYHVFESSSGVLTLYFESGSREDAVVAKVATEPADLEAPQVAPALDVQQSMGGEKGDSRLYEIAVDATGDGGRILLSAGKVEKYSHFFLDSPKRFVLDMRDTVLSLDGNEMQMDHPLVDRIRIRQFQSHPVPITRLVLDLSGETQVSVNPVNGGLLLSFAATTERLAQLLEEKNEAFAIDHEDDTNLAQTHHETNEMPLEVSDVASEEIEETANVTGEAVAQSVQNESEAVVETELTIHPVEVMLDPEPETLGLTGRIAELGPTPDPVVEPEESQEMVAVAGSDQSVADVRHDAPDATSENVSSSNSLESDAPEQSEQVAVVTADASSDEMVENEVLDAERVALDEPSVVEAGETTMTVDPSLQDTASTKEEAFVSDQQDAAPERNPIVGEPQLVSDVATQESTEFETLQTEVVAESTSTDVPLLDSDSAMKANEDQVVAEAVKGEEHSTGAERVHSEEAATELVAAEMVKDEKVPDTEVAEEVLADVSDRAEVKKTSNEPVLGVEDPILLKATPKESSFVMASDVDLEMEEFLESEGEDLPLYKQMRDVVSTRSRTSGPVVVTNANIARSKALKESSNLQDEEDIPGDPEDLFREKQDSFQSLGDDEPKYRGFPIMIDIREQPVLDLLRFLADEVGFNLYVDSSVGRVTATYRFRNIPWDQALDIILANANLDKEFRNGVLRVATTKKFRDEEKARAALRTQRELSVPTETVTVDLNYAKARDIVPIVSEYLSPRGSIIRDDRTNILIIRDIPKYMVEIRTLINRLDKMIPQVSIEARIVETSTRFLRELGIQWGLTAQYAPETGTETGVDFPRRISLGGPRIGQPRTTLTGPEGGYAVNLPVVSESASGVGLTLGNFLDNFKLDISMQLLESEGQGQIISSPKVTTQNNRTAVITNGQRIPIQTIQRGTITTRFIDAVLELQVTPQITADETIIMDLVVDKSEPDFSRASGAGGNPIINVSRAETQVLVKNGGTAVIGGIFSLNEQNSETGVPTLRKVPVLRRLFSNSQKQYSNQELLIFVTPKIVKY